MAMETFVFRTLGYVAIPEDALHDEMGGYLVDGVDLALECSYKLAQLMQRYMPADKATQIRWNPCALPSDYEIASDPGVMVAAQQFFEFVDENLFPLDPIEYDTLAELWIGLNYIAPATRADPAIQDGLFDTTGLLEKEHPTSLYRLVAFLVRSHVWSRNPQPTRDDTFVAWGLPVKPRVDLDGFDAALKSWTNPYAKHLDCLLHMIDMSTGWEYLDIPYEVIGSEDDWFEWDDQSVGYCVDEWIGAKQVIDAAQEVVNAAEQSPELRHEIAELVRPFLLDEKPKKGKKGR